MFQILDNLTQQEGLQTGFAYCIVLVLAIVAGLFLLTKGGCIERPQFHFGKSIGGSQRGRRLDHCLHRNLAPELFTSIAAIRSSAGLIIGNIIGSNIANIGLILGLALMVKSVDTRDTISKSQSITLLVLSIAFCGFLLFNPSKELEGFSGALLLGFIGVYLFCTTAKALEERKQASEAKIDEKSPDASAKALLLSTFFILLSTAALWAGSDFLVFGAKNLATIAGVPEELIGFSILAVGTSLPELAASISLVKKGEHKMLLGNIVGSNLFNIGLVGGVAGTFGPVRSTTQFPWIDYISLLLLTGLLCFWLRGRTLSKREGFILLAGYLISSLFTWILNGNA